MTHSYTAHGKLLLFGEYFVLDGCTALAWPTVFGQKLEVNEEESLLPGMHWKSYNHKGDLWFEAFFDKDLQLLQTIDEEKSFLLQRILESARELNPVFLQDDAYHTARIFADYPSEWGLGSSSTLIHLIAQWAGVDPFDLFFASFSGSGYDMACAGATDPLLYRLEDGKPSWEPVSLPDSLLKDVVFVYLGNKQDSREGIAHYKEHRSSVQEIGKQLDTLLKELLAAATKEALLQAMQTSEQLISQALHLPKVKELFFADFPGAVKSLGAWGGDFIMALPEQEGFDSPTYFREKGFEVCFAPSEILL